MSESSQDARCHRAPQDRTADERHEELSDRIEAIERAMSGERGLRDQCSNCSVVSESIAQGFGSRGYCAHRPPAFGAMQNCAHHVIKQECDGSGWLNRRSLRTRLCSGCGNCGHGTRRDPAPLPPKEPSGGES